MKKYYKILLWGSLFSISMAYLESAVVVYLRELYYPNGFSFPLQKIIPFIYFTEIGREVARLGSALGIKVIVSDPCLKDDPNVTPVTLDVLLSTSDFISVNCPLTNGTRDLIGAEEIAKMKDNVFLVNTARGGIINEKALLDALNEGKVVAALDVLVSKPPFEDDLSKKLIMNENVIVTPHSIGQTFEAIQEKGEGVIKAINDHVDSRK